MPTTKECPQCGEQMQLKVSERRATVPGQAKTSTHTVREWICPECDHFEEADEGDG